MDLSDLTASPALLPAALGTLSLVFLPVLLTYLPQLWAREYYRFFPFAFATTIGLAISRRGQQAVLKASRLRWTSRIVTFLIAEAALLGGILLGSPWPCFVAFVMVLGLLLDFWRDSESERSLTYLLLPLILVIRPPLHLDETAVQGLQTVTSRLASSFLAAARVDHILSGNIIQPMTGPALLVEEACSGVQSLFTLMFIAAFMGVYRRYTVTRTLLLVASSVFWALMLNVFRVMTIALAQTQLELDLTTGWKHEVVGYLGILLAVGFLLSTDRLLLFFFSGIPDDAMKNPSVNVFVAAWNWFFVAPGLTSQTTVGHQTQRGGSRRKSQADSTTEVAQGKKRFAGASIGVACVLLVSAIPAWSLPGLGLTKSSRKTAEFQVSLTSVDATWLPESTLPGCKVLSFDIEERDVASQFGQFSNKWIVSASYGNVLHSMDHSFNGWHNLTVCYRSIGWRLENLEDVSLDLAGTSWPVVCAEFLKPTGERAYLCFSLFTTEGTPVMPEGETGGLAGFRNRMRQSQTKGQQTIQVQSLLESLTPLSQESRNQLVEAHGKVRDELKQRIAEKNKSANLAGATCPRKRSVMTANIRLHSMNKQKDLLTLQIYRDVDSASHEPAVDKGDASNEST